MGSLTQPLRWHGGKSYLAKRIIDLMPPHTRYLEAFAGGTSVLINKPHEGIAEWANDTNRQLANFWHVLASEEMFEKFRRQVEATPLSQELFECESLLYRTFSEWQASAVDTAVGFFIRMRQSRQGLGRDYCTPTSRTRRGMNENVSAWLSAVDGLPEIHARLRRVEIWNRPAVEAIRKLDSPELLVYADPPYLHATRSTTGEYGDQEMSDDDHRELLETLASMKGRLLLSGYRSALYDDFASASGWSRVDIEIDNKASSKRTKEKKVESIWMNY